MDHRWRRALWIVLVFAVGNTLAPACEASSFRGDSLHAAAAAVVAVVAAAALAIGSRDQRR